jgi:hypothetical protein
MIREAIWLNGFGGPKEYECEFLIPDNISGKEENEIFKNTLNKIRRILGIEEVDEV